MNKRTLLATSIIVLLLVISGLEGIVLIRDHSKSTPAPHHTTAATKTYTKLNINLQNGKLTAAPATYLVHPGVGLEFHITSNVLGKVSVPTNPPQTINFTQSPLVFRFTASKMPGTYGLYYEANGSTKVVLIGSITVPKT